MDEKIAMDQQTRVFGNGLQKPLLGLVPTSNHLCTFFMAVLLNHHFCTFISVIFIENELGSVITAGMVAASVVLTLYHTDKNIRVINNFLT